MNADERERRDHVAATCMFTGNNIIIHISHKIGLDTVIDTGTTEQYYFNFGPICMTLNDCTYFQ